MWLWLLEVEVRYETESELELTLHVSFICEDKVHGRNNNEELTWFLALPLQHIIVSTRGTEHSSVQAGILVTHRRLNELCVN